MNVELYDKSNVSVAHLVPSRGRAELMEKALPKMQPVWNRVGTYLALENRELKKYERVIDALPKVHIIAYDNPDACVGKSLDVLRSKATKHGYDYYVMSDDNCRFTRKSFTNLVRATAEYDKPVHMAGAHPTAAFFDKGRIRRTLVVKHGIRTYRKMAWILRCVSHAMYAPFKYPHELPCYADRYFSMWLISKGFLEFRATPDAPFDKRRFVQGGIGTKESRGRSALGLAMMAKDFAPTWGHLEVRIPWEEIIKLNQPTIRIRTKLRA
jgi:hypothetical protein